jgi:predicted MFS family arabinose efflux permease
MIAGLALLAMSTLAFAYANSMAMLFAARCCGGRRWHHLDRRLRDDRRPLWPSERGRAMGLAMAGSTLGIIIGRSSADGCMNSRHPSPFLVVAAMAFAELGAFALVAPRTRGSVSSVSIARVLTHRPVAMTVLVVVAGSGTLAMLEPVIPLVAEARWGLGPPAIGTLFGIAAIASTTMHPIYGRLSDRWGGRRLMMMGLVGSALVLPLINFATDFRRPSSPWCQCGWCSVWW